MDYFTYQDALMLLRGIGACNLGHRWMDRFPESFYQEFTSTKAKDAVRQFLEATRGAYTSVYYDENISTLPLGDVLRLRAEQFDGHVGRLEVAKRLREGESVRDIFPEVEKRNLSTSLAQHDPYDYD